MELKSKFVLNSMWLVYGSNRTFMELKYASVSARSAVGFVLIVPLWN